MLDFYRTLRAKTTFFQKNTEHLPKLTRHWAIKQILTNFRRLISHRCIAWLEWNKAKINTQLKNPQICKVTNTLVKTHRSNNESQQNKNCFEPNGMKLWYVKTWVMQLWLLRGKMIVLRTNIRREKKLKVRSLIIHLRTCKKKNKLKANKF